MPNIRVLITMVFLQYAMAQQTLTWTGALDNDWHKKCNWNPMQVPTCQDTVVIPTVSSGNYPVISGVAHCKELNISATITNALTIQSGAQLEISAAGGSCTGTPTNTGGTLAGPINIIGPTSVCAGKSVTWYAPHSSGVLWNWNYPSGWTLVAQGGDSIVLIPDTSDGVLSVEICDNTCACGNSTLNIVADSCKSFCLAVGGSNHDEGYSVIETASGDFVISGYTLSFGAGNMDAYFVQIDVFGNLIGTRTVGGGNSDYGKAIVQTSDGGYINAGETYSFGNTGGGIYPEVWVTKLDASGNIQWTRTIGGSSEEFVGVIIQTSDGGYAVAGETRSFGQGSNDVYVVKLDASGNLVWTRTIGGGAGDGALAIREAPNGDLVVSGYTNSFGQGLSDIYVIRLDATGNVLWTRSIGGPDAEFAYQHVIMNDGSIVVAGYTYSYSQGNEDLYLIKLDATGNLQWTRTVGGANSDGAFSVTVTQDGGIVAAGYTNSFGQGSFDIYVVKFDNAGNLLWTRTIGSAGYDLARSIIETSTGDLLVVGFTDSFGSGNRDFYIVRLDKNGNMTPCPGGCQLSSGGTVSSGGTTSSGGATSSGGTVSSGGTAGSGGTLTNLCP